MNSANAQTSTATPSVPAPTTATGSAPSVMPASGPMDQLMAFLPLVMIFGIFYFLIIRPQQRKMKDHRTMVTGLQAGDKIVTAGGLIGTVAKIVDDNEVVIELADNIKVRAVRHTISQITKDVVPNVAVNDDVINPYKKNKSI